MVDILSVANGKLSSGQKKLGLRSLLAITEILPFDDNRRVPFDKIKLSPRFFFFHLQRRHHSFSGVFAVWKTFFTSESKKNLSSTLLFLPVISTLLPSGIPPSRAFCKCLPNLGINRVISFFCRRKGVEAEKKKFTRWLEVWGYVCAGRGAGGEGKK